MTKRKKNGWPIKKGQFSKFCNLGRLVLDESSPGHQVSSIGLSLQPYIADGPTPKYPQCTTANLFISLEYS